MNLVRLACLAALLLLAASFPFPSIAGPSEDADTAYTNGDYATALRLWRELAQQAERGLLDFLTVKDGLSLQSDDHFQADSRTDRLEDASTRR